MEFFLFVVLAGLVIAALSQRSRAAAQRARIERLELGLNEASRQLAWAQRELGYARGGYDALAARLAPLERALFEARQAPVAAPVDKPVASLPAAEGPEGEPAAAHVEAPANAEEAAAPEHITSTATEPGGDVVAQAAQPIPTDRPVDDLAAHLHAAAARLDVNPRVAARGAPSAVRPAPTGPTASGGQAIDWERWLGVRGAAAAGAAILVLASLYFFKYSIDAGFFGPTARVVTGTGVGLACLLGSVRARGRDHVVMADWLGGAGISILYTAFWSAHSLYHLIPSSLAFALMIAVTAACVALSVRYSSQVIAVLGLLGGFITPFALSSGEDHPIGLFGYLLLLDVALLGVGRRKGWRALSVLCMTGTLLYQVVWIGGRMTPDTAGLGLGIIVVFSVLFAATARPADSASEQGRLLEGASVLAPFVFGLYFGLRADIAPQIAPVALMLVLVSTATCVLAALRGVPTYPLFASIGSVAVLLGWAAAHDPVTGAPALLVSSLAIATVFHGYVEVRRRLGQDDDGFTREAAAAAVAAFGGMIVLFVEGAFWHAPLAPLAVVAGSALLASLLLRQAGLPGREPLHLGVALALGMLLPALHGAQEHAAFYTNDAASLAVSLTAAGALLGFALARRDGGARRAALHSAALLALLLLFEPLAFPRALSAGAILGIPALLGLFALVAAAALGSGAWVVAATLAVAFVDTTCAVSHATFPVADAVPAAGLSFTLAWLAGSALLFTAWPVAFARRFEGAPSAFRASALAGPAFLLAVRAVWIALFGSGAIGLVPAGFALLAFSAALLTRDRLARTDEARPAALLWLFGAAIALTSLAVPMQFRNETVTLGWSLLGAVLVALWVRFDHPGLKYAGAAHLLAVTLRLTLNPFVFAYHERDPSVLFNWLLPAYWAPALALFGAWYLLSPLEVSRLRPWERGFYGSPRPLGALGSALGVIGVLFTWINLMIVNAYSPTGSLEWSFHHEPARDLTMSVAWAVYALLLLTVGTVRKSAALRWASLILIITTALKVFLYDLAHLRDLYRVASLVGLAFSLILISLAYQRFVFGAPGPGAPRDGEG